MTKREAYEAMATRIVELRMKAETEKCALTSDEKQEIANLEGEAKRFKASLDYFTSGHVNLHNIGENTNPPEEWRDSTGKPVRLFGAGESVAEYRMREDGLARPEYGIGTICKALALGATTELEKRALTEGTPSAGGYGVPILTSAQIIDAMRPLSAVFTAGARTIPLDNWKLIIARIATDPVASWRSESAILSEQDTVFDSITFLPQSVGFYFKVSRELLQDSLNLNEAVQNVIAAAMAAALDSACLIGSGTPPTPKGVSNITGVGSVSMGTNGAQLTNFDPFVDLVSTLLTANAPMPSVMVMAPRTFGALSKLKCATTNAYMERPDLLANMVFLPTMRLPINETQGSANTCSRVITGDWSQMLVGTRLDVTIDVLRERFAEYGQIGFVAFARFDMQVQHPAAFAQLIGILP